MSTLITFTAALAGKLGIARRWVGPSDPADELTPEECYNSKLLAIESPFSALATGGVSNFFALFAIQLGAANSLVGWLTSGPALINLLWVIPGGRLIQRSKNFAYPMAYGALLQRVVLITLALIPFLPGEWRPIGLVVLVTLASVPDAVRWLALQTACGEMFQPRHMAKAVGRRWATMSICMVVLTPLLGQFVDLLPYPLNFQLLFAGIGLVAMATVWFALRLRLPPRDLEMEGQPEGKEGRSLLRQFREQRAFIRFEIAMLVLHLAVFGAAPLLRIYWVRDLGATGLWVGVLTAASSIGSAIGTLFWGRLSRPERDRRNVLITSIGVVALYPLLSAAFDILLPQIGVALLAGFFAGGNGLMLFNRTVQVSPRKQRPTFLAIHSITVNAAAFVAPLISAALADSLGTRAVLFGVAALGLIGALSIYLLGWNELPKGESGCHTHPLTTSE